jgi:hypothetical protein
MDWSPERNERFWSKVQKTDGCWEWKAAQNSAGYGIFGIGDEEKPHRIERSHRISWRLHHGEIPPGMFVCHHCDNRKCVRPDHLFLGTNRDNMHDCAQKGRSSKPPVTRWNKIALPQEILDRLGTESDASLGKRAGVSKFTIQRARKAAGIESWSVRNGHPTKFKSGGPHPCWSRKKPKAWHEFNERKKREEVQDDIGSKD